MNKPHGTKYIVKVNHPDTVTADKIRRTIKHALDNDKALLNLDVTHVAVHTVNKSTLKLFGIKNG